MQLGRLAGVARPSHTRLGAVPQQSCPPQARSNALSLISALFQRSRCFRRLLVRRLATFLELAVGHRPGLPLPGPPAAGQALRARALQAVAAWKEQHGQHYPEVRYGTALQLGEGARPGGAGGMGVVMQRGAAGVLWYRLVWGGLG